jgi:hypothetical protein
MIFYACNSNNMSPAKNQLNQSFKKVVGLTNIESVDILSPAKERGQACKTKGEVHGTDKDHRIV